MPARKVLISRRHFLQTSAIGGATMAGGLFTPFISHAADRPVITHGVQSGDVVADSAMVWARTDRPAQMLVEVATTESFPMSWRCRRSQCPPKSTSAPSG